MSTEWKQNSEAKQEAIHRIKVLRRSEKREGVKEGQKETGFYFIFISYKEDGLLLNMLNMQEVSRLTDSND